MTAAALALVTGCSSGSSSSVGSTDSHTYNVGESDNGHTLDVHFGDTLMVTLHSTYWTIEPSDGFILDPQGIPQTSTTSPTCTHTIPGSGCGTVTETYNIGHVGTSTVKAHRTSCGEALRCTGTAGDWSLKVVAS